MKHRLTKILNVFFSAVLILSIFSFAGAVSVSADSAPITITGQTSDIETVTVYIPTTRMATVTEFLTSTVTKTKIVTTTESGSFPFDFSNGNWWIIAVIVAGVVIGLILIVLIIKR